MAHESLERASGGGVPESQRFVSVPGQHELAIGEKAAEKISVDGARMLDVLRSSCPVATSQSFKTLSAPAESARLPSGEKAAALTAPAWPSKLRISPPLAMSHNLTVLWEAAESALLPSGENFTD